MWFSTSACPPSTRCSGRVFSQPRALESVVPPSDTLAEVGIVARSIPSAEAPMASCDAAELECVHDSFVARILFVPTQLLDGFETTLDNVSGMLPCPYGGGRFHSQSLYTRTVATMFGDAFFVPIARKAHPTGAESRPR